MFAIFARIGVTLGCLVMKHAWSLYFLCDPLQPQRNRDKQLTSHMYVPIGVILLVCLYGTFGLQYEATGTIQCENLAKNPHIFTHQISPSSIWDQLDFAVALDFLSSLAVLLALIGVSPIRKRLQLYGDEKGRVFTRNQEFTAQESEQMLAVQKKLKPFLLGLVFGTFGCFLLFFNVNLFLNDVYVVSLTSAIFWLALFPLFFLYLFFALVGSIVYILLSLMYIQIRQQLLLKQFNALNETAKRMRTPKQASCLFSRYRVINMKLLSICTFIGEYSRLSWPFLSIMVPFFILFQAYFLYIVAFIEGPFGQRVVFYFGILDCNLFLFLITRKCALIVQFNRAFEKANRVFGFAFAAKGGFRWAPRYKLLMAEMFATPRRFHPYAFKLFAHYRITSKTYFLILSYISIYFMFVVKQANKRMAPW